ncbi:Hypothetical predicted protein [Paramuricea clavata]|uniref:Uncharacterized protein n=1 Tax=Paramuricea clavata TaxID=317549 RepID=A0A6S7JYH9_PARCT|nr:Hypothetical predicted protein [Paramuricea clavata]
MKTTARILIAVIVILQHRSPVAKGNNKFLSSQQKDKSSATLQINMNNNFIYQFAQDRKRTLLHGYTPWAIPEQDRKHKLEKREPTKTTSTEIRNKTTYRKLQNTNKSLQTTPRSSQNTQRIFLKNEAFFNKFDKPIQNKFNKSNKKSKRVAKSIDYDAVTPESRIPRKVTFGSSPTLSESKFLNNLSSKISLRHHSFFHHIFKPREMNDNYANSNCVGLQTKTTFLLPTILNVLCKALLVHPFTTWKLKHKFSSMKDIRVHENVLHEVIHNPWNERLKHKLYKVLQGEDVYLDVFGGSNTAGAGLRKDEGDLEGRYSLVITHWWNKTITPITGSNLKLRQIAMGGTSSEFFQFCFASYIHEKPDLVFIEMAVNDMRDLPSNANKSLPLEQLTRQLLVYPKEPALVYINLFNCPYCNYSCTNIEDYGQDLLTDTYNITSLKWRNAVCSKNARNNLKNPCDLICSDGMHINLLGHAHISLMLINLFRRILLDHISTVITNSGVSHRKKSTRVARENKSTRVTSGITLSMSDQLPPRILRKQIALPRPVLIKKTTKIISEPLCWTNLSPNYHRINDVKNNLDVIITKTKGFFLETAKIGEKCSKPPCRVDSVSSWTGKTIGANITFSFTVPEENYPLSAEGIQTRSVAIGIRTCWNCGVADMWLDSDYKSKKIFSTKLHYGRTCAKILALHVEPGNHTLNVEIVRQGKVSIVAIMVGPSDGPY